MGQVASQTGSFPFFNKTTVVAARGTARRRPVVIHVVSSFMHRDIPGLLLMLGYPLKRHLTVILGLQNTGIIHIG